MTLEVRHSWNLERTPLWVTATVPNVLVIGNTNVLILKWHSIQRVLLHRLFLMHYVLSKLEQPQRIVNSSVSNVVYLDYDVTMTCFKSHRFVLHGSTDLQCCLSRSPLSASARNFQAVERMRFEQWIYGLQQQYKFALVAGTIHEFLISFIYDFCCCCQSRYIARLPIWTETGGYEGSAIPAVPVPQTAEDEAELLDRIDRLKLEVRECAIELAREKDLVDRVRHAAVLSTAVFPGNHMGA